MSNLLLVGDFNSKTKDGGYQLLVNKHKDFPHIPRLPCLCIYLFVSRLLTRRKNDTDLKFGTHTPIDLI